MVKTKSRKLIIFGDSAFAEVAYEYFTYDSNYEVVAFTVSNEYLKKKELFGKPVVPFEGVDKIFEPSRYDMFIALTYLRLNTIRERFFNAAKDKGYTLASYTSSNSLVWKNVVFGENVFVFEGTNIQPFSRIGDNVILWSGSNVAHHSIINAHCFISSHVVISGFCKIGRNTFIGVNSTINHNVNINAYNFIGSGCLIVKDTNKGDYFKGQMSNPQNDTSFKKFEINI